MITEEDLRRLLADAAESVPPPGRAPHALLAAVAEQVVTPTRRQPPRLKIAAMAAVVLAVVALGATLRSDPKQTFRATGAAIDTPSPSTTVPGEGGGDGGANFGGLVPAYSAATSNEAEKDGLGSAPVDLADRGQVAATQPADSARVIKTGSLDLEVPAGAFNGTVDRITAKTIGLGGYVAESTTSESGDAPSGAITVRVPDESFEQLLSDLRKLGEVQAVSSKGTDVTAQFTDLQARLSALVATRDRLSTVLSEAVNVPDILAVQDRITQVQVEIEQIQGQQRLLEDQTSFGTLAVTLGEPGAAVAVDATPDEGLGQAWDDARRRFGDSIEALVSWSGSAAVVLIVGLLLLGMVRLAWVGTRRRLV